MIYNFHIKIEIIEGIHVETFFKPVEHVCLKFTRTKIDLLNFGLQKCFQTEPKHTNIQFLFEIVILNQICQIRVLNLRIFIRISHFQFMTIIILNMNRHGSI